MMTILADAGPLVAFLNHRDSQHDWAAKMLRHLPPRLVTCEAVLSEAFHLLENTSQGCPKLLELLERGVVVSQFNLAEELPAVSGLMRRYADVPMSLADACLVRMAELSEDAAVFTTDGDFRHYRRHRRAAIPLLFPG